jgi:two-component system cell cycle sensor histidine kinase PleC
LRTPLNAILGFSEVMKTELFGPVSNPLYVSYIRNIHQSGEYLLALINEVLDLARIEAGNHELAEEELDLAQVVGSCCQLMELRAAGKCIRLTFAHAPDMPKLWADDRAIRQITLNLLSNAIKFIPLGSEIRVSVGETRSGGQYLSVEDNGPGIPDSEIRTVLSTFGRGQSAVENAEPGSGLGLPIVRSLVELHDGTFRFLARPGEGLEVQAIFPAWRRIGAGARQSRGIEATQHEGSETAERKAPSDAEKHAA